ncbi:MAG: two-component system histidine kinase PnpS [Solirubrobacterales bacterium]
MPNGFATENSRMQAILTSMADGVVGLDNEGRIMQFNRAAEKIFMRREQEVLGHTFESMLNLIKVDQMVRTVLKTGREVLAEMKVFPGSEYIFHIHILPIKGVSTTEGAVAVFHDVTDARKFDQMRSEFVANVSHELRTPLTSIKGFVETLLDGALEDQMLCRRFLTIIDNETNRLTRLIEDLLNLSAIESKEIRVHLRRVNLIESVKTVFNVLGPQAAEKKIRMELIYPRCLPPVQADEDLIGQVLINLIDNAIKYTPAGGRIVVRISADDKWISVHIMDSGMGIPKDSLPRLFERFYRVDKARSRGKGGTGLGLAIVKHIMELHEGEVFVESELGVGTTFTIRLRYSKHDPQENQSTGGTP